MTSPIARQSRLPRCLILGVCIASTLVAGLMGDLALYLYFPIHAPMEHRPPPSISYVGPGLGAATGLSAGITWCWLMMGLASSKRRRKLGWWGALVGIGVGSLSTMLLHLGLMITADQWRQGAIAVGLMFGIPTGATLGAICGYVLRRAVNATNASAATMRPDASCDSPDSSA